MATSSDACSTRLTARERLWFARIEKYLASTLTQRAFCERESLAYSTFQLWLGKYRRQAHSLESNAGSPTSSSRSAGAARERFLPITIAKRPGAALALAGPSHEPATSCIIEFPHGVVLHLLGPLDAQLLTQLINPMEHES
jgi:hypothetical protein